MAEKELKIFQSTKSASSFLVSGTKERAHLNVSGEASKNPKVMAEIKRIRTGGCDMATAEWTARMLANTY